MSATGRDFRAEDAFEQVFGKLTGGRNDAQGYVWDVLRNICYVDKSTVVHDKEGRIDPLGTVAAEARRSVFLDISAQIQLASLPRLEPEPKPKIK